ncbi:MAG: methyltransferase domain-containing protein [Epsilonproteobacteria bacterium]|nr:methyltransferase domain-containing protein [Campylobacterota bacterium]
MYSKSHQVEFEKYAKNYDSNAFIQKKVAKELVQKLNFKPKTILDIGCGTGEIYKNISWKIDRFVGVDCSSSMCKLHPQSKNIEIICSDFESLEFVENIKKLAPFDLLISSSSLQWAKDIGEVFKIYSKLSKKIAFSIFTNKTFKAIYEITNRESFLPSFDSVYLLSKTLNNCIIERKIYKMDFVDNLSMLRYIKEGGISGGNRVLDYKEIKYLLNNYPHSYLEFEVAFIIK